VARRPIADFDAYADRLGRFVFRSGFMMKPLFAKAREAKKRVIYSEGEDERVLRATQVVLEERLAKPVLIGRPEVMQERIKRYGLAITAGVDFEVIDPRSDPRYRDYVATYLKVAGRKGVTPDVARIVVRTSPSVIGALALHRGDVDALICGLEGRFESRLKHIRTLSAWRRAPRNSRRSRSSSPRPAPISSLTRTSGTTQRRGDRRNRDRRRSSRTAVRRHAEDRADLAFRFRLRKLPVGAENARCARHSARTRAGLEADGEMQADTALSLLARQRVISDCRIVARRTF